MRAAIYARYSAGPNQTEQSIDGQLRVCKEFCAGKDLQVVGEYCDRHISGKTDDRPEFQRLIADAKKKKFDAVVVYKTDRFARNKYDSAIYKRELKKNGISIYYAAEAIPDGPEGIILESLMEGLAEYYSAELAQKIRRGMRESALKCQYIGSGRLLGYTTDDQKRYIIDEEEAAAVRDIFEMYIKGVPCADICEYLNSRGFHTKYKKPFNKNSVTRIIQNKKYTGVYSWNDIEVPGGMPRIISDDIFALAQNELAKRRVRKKSAEPRAEYLLAGKLFCGYCKESMHGVSGTSKAGKRYYYYYCKNTRGPVKSCNKKKLPRDYIEQEVIRLTLDYVLQPDALNEIADKLHTFLQQRDTRANELEIYEKRYAANKKAIDNIVAMIENGVQTKTLPARLQALEKEQETIESEMLVLKNAPGPLTKDQIAFALNMYAVRLPNEDEQAYRKRIITCFVSEVYAYDDEIQIYFNITDPAGALHTTSAVISYAAVFDQRYSDSSVIIAGRTPGIVILSTKSGFVLIKNKTS